MTASSAHPRTRWAAVVLLLVVGIAAAMQFAKVATVFVPVSQAYGAAGTAGAMLISAPAVVGLALGLTASVLVSRLGFRRVVLGCLALGAVLSLTQALIPPLPLFLAARALEGVAHLGLVISCPVLIIQLSAPRRVSLAMSIWGTFFGLAFAIAGWLGPLAAEAWGVGSVFLGHGLLLAVLFAAVLTVLPRTPVDGPQPVSAHDGFLRAHLSAYRSPRAVLPGCVFVFHTLMYTALITFLPLFTDSGTAATLLIWMPLVSIAGTVAAGLLADRLMSTSAVLLLGYAGVGVLVVLVWALLGAGSGILTAALAMMFFSGLIQGGSFGLIPALSTDPTVAARSNGVLTQLGNVGNLLGPPLFAAAITSAGGAGAGPQAFTPATVWVVVFCAAGAVVSLLALRLTGARAPQR